jgi:hypothetical protein
MSITTFVEATSADPFVRDLHRKAVRLLNDSSLDRKRREFHMRRLQSILIEHLAKQAARAEKQAAKSAQREQVSRDNRNQGVADLSQVLARRKEFSKALPQQVEPVQQATPVVQGPLQSKAAVNANQMTGRRRPVLTLKRA